MVLPYHGTVDVSDFSGVLPVIVGYRFGIACGPHFIAVFRIIDRLHDDIRESMVITGRVEKSVLAVADDFCRAACVGTDYKHRRKHIFYSDPSESL